MRVPVTYESVSLVVAIASMVIAIGSLVASIAAVRAARSSLSQAERVAERDRQDWRQRKWFDLYFKTAELYDFFEFYQKQYADMPLSQSDRTEWLQDWNKLMLEIRGVHSMAAVFPRDPILDKLFSSTAVFKDRREAASKERLNAIFDSLEELRMRARMDASVLN